MVLTHVLRKSSLFFEVGKIAKKSRKKGGRRKGERYKKRRERRKGKRLMGKGEG
jgi:hypothetical protein